MMPFCRLFATAAFSFAALITSALPLDAQAAVVKRNVNLRVGPSKSKAIVAYVFHVKPGGRDTVNCGEAAISARPVLLRPPQPR